jgi:hypothetical protein
MNIAGFILTWGLKGGGSVLDDNRDSAMEEKEVESRGGYWVIGRHCPACFWFEEKPDRTEANGRGSDTARASRAHSSLVRVHAVVHLVVQLAGVYFCPGSSPPIGFVHE